MTKISIRSFFSQKHRLLMLVIITVVVISIIFSIILITRSGDPNLKKEPIHSVSTIDVLDDSAKVDPVLENVVNPTVVSFALKAVVGMSFLISIANMIFLLFFLLKKNRLEGNETSLSSNEMERIMALFEASIKMMNENIYSSRSNEGNSEEVLKSLSDIKFSMDRYLEKLDKNDEVIRKYRDGYDMNRFKIFLQTLARIDLDLVNIIQSEQVGLGDIEQLKMLMEHALAEYGVELFTPAIGENYINTRGLSDNPKIEKTENEEEDYLIKEVLQPGYKLLDGNVSKIIIPAKVKIYKKM